MLQIRRVLPVVLFTLILLGRIAWADEPSSEHPLPDLKQAIADGVKMLEAKDYRGFLKKFVPPERLAMIKIDDPATVKEFGADRAPVLLKVFKYVLDRSPDISDEGSTATYSLEQLDGGPNTRPIIFKKLDGSWYIVN